MNHKVSAGGSTGSHPHNKDRETLCDYKTKPEEGKENNLATQNPF